MRLINEYTRTSYTTLRSGRVVNHDTTHEFELEWFYADNVQEDFMWLISHRGRLCKLAIDDEVHQISSATIATNDDTFAQTIRARFSDAR